MFSHAQDLDHEFLAHGVRTLTSMQASPCTEISTVY